MSRTVYQQGFTLIEALIAMVIVAVLATALLRISAGTVVSARDMEEKTLKTMIASNYIVDIQQKKIWPALGSLSTTVTMANRTWQVDVDTQATNDPYLRSLEVHVTPTDNYGTSQEKGPATLVGFVGKN